MNHNELLNSSLIGPKKTPGYAFVCDYRVTDYFVVQLVSRGFFGKQIIITNWNPVSSTSINDSYPQTSETFRMQ